MLSSTCYLAIDLTRVLEVEEELNYLKPRAEHLERLYDIERSQNITLKQNISDGLKIVHKIQKELLEKKEELFQKEELLNSLQLRIVTLESQLSELSPDIGVEDSLLDQLILNVNLP